MNIQDPRFYQWEFNSPYEIYASGRWTGSRDDPAWQKRAAEWAVRNSAVYRGEPLSERIPVLTLVKELFFLHLTVRQATPEIAEALGLLEGLEGPENSAGSKEVDIPFEAEGDPDFVSSAWLFNAAVFGLADIPSWRETAGTAGRRIKYGDRFSGSRSLYNFLRGTLVIPGSEKIPGVAEAIRLLADRQDSSGGIDGLAPWQLYNLMAHSSHPAALEILEKLEGPLLQHQNRDASWGEGAQKPLAAFLMAHGLQNRGFFS